MKTYDELRYEYMAELLSRVKERNSSKDIERLHKMFEGLCKKISWIFSGKYNLSFYEVEGFVCSEFMLLVRLYRPGGNMTLTSFLNQWLYFKVDRVIRQFLGKNKKYHRVYLNTEGGVGEGNPLRLVDKLISPGDFNFHLEFSEFIADVRKTLGELDVDIIILYGLYNMPYKQISDIVGISVESARRHVRKIKKLLLQKTYKE